MIHEDATYELKGMNSVHRILEDNMWILDENFWLLQSNQSLSSFIGDELVKRDKKYAKKRPDFVCASGENRLVIVEIKRPSHELTVEDLDQLETYTVIAQDYKEKDYRSIRGYLLGKKKSSDIRRREGMRSGLEVKTYNDVIENVKTKYRQYLDRFKERGLEVSMAT